MSWLSSIRSRFRGSNEFDQARAKYGPMDDFWYGGQIRAAAGAMRVDASTIVNIPEASACLNYIAGTVAALPLITYERGANGSKTRADGHPLAPLLHHRPNDMQTAFEFRYQMTWDLLLHRNAYAEIVFSSDFKSIESLTRLDPERIEVRTLRTDGVLDWVYDVKADGNVRRMRRHQVMHLRMPPLISSNILGRSLIWDARRTFARALAIQEFVTTFFESDATPASIITTPGSFKTVEQANEFRERWIDMFRASRRQHVPAILDGVTKFDTVPHQNDKAQLDAMYKEVALQIVRLWRVPPHKIGILDKATFTNIEHQGQEAITDCLMPVLIAWEQAIRRDLILPTEPIFCEHNIDGLLRGDILARYQAYAIGRNWGWLSVNDVLRRENMNPIAGGDTYLQPLNMVPAGSESATRAAFIGFVDREAEIVEAIEAYRQPKLIGHNGGPPIDATAETTEDAA